MGRVPISVGPYTLCNFSGTDSLSDRAPVSVKEYILILQLWNEIYFTFPAPKKYIFFILEHKHEFNN